MTRTLAVFVLGLALVGGARGASSGSVPGSVDVFPLEVALAVSPVQIPVAGSATATATVRNLGPAPVANILATLHADPGLAVGTVTKTIPNLDAGGAARASWTICGLLPGSYFLVVSAATSAASVDSPARLLQVTGGEGGCR